MDHVQAFTAGSEVPAFSQTVSVAQSTEASPFVKSKSTFNETPVKESVTGVDHGITGTPSPQSVLENERSPANIRECNARAQRFFRCFPLFTNDTLWDSLNTMADSDHILACDMHCFFDGKTCDHPKKTFLSTRNSRRSCHVYLFAFYLLGGPSHVTDEMLKTLRRQLRPACPLGLRFVCLFTFVFRCDFILSLLITSMNDDLPFKIHLPQSWCNIVLLNHHESLLTVQ